MLSTAVWLHAKASSKEWSREAVKDLRRTLSGHITTDIWGVPLADGKGSPRSTRGTAGPGISTPREVKRCFVSGFVTSKPSSRRQRPKSAPRQLNTFSARSKTWSPGGLGGKLYSSARAAHRPAKKSSKAQGEKSFRRLVPSPHSNCEGSLHGKVLMQLSGVVERGTPVATIVGHTKPPGSSLEPPPSSMVKANLGKAFSAFVVDTLSLALRVAAEDVYCVWEDAVLASVSKSSFEAPSAFRGRVCKALSTDANVNLTNRALQLVDMLVLEIAKVTDTRFSCVPTRHSYRARALSMAQG